MVAQAEWGLVFWQLVRNVNAATTGRNFFMAVVDCYGEAVRNTIRHSHNERASSERTKKSKNLLMLPKRLPHPASLAGRCNKCGVLLSKCRDSLSGLRL
jgi:hypothetical protein